MSKADRRRRDRSMPMRSTAPPGTAVMQSLARAGSPPWGPAMLIGATATVMLIATWGTWADAVVDFGRELYVPWRLGAGQVLYRDMAHFNGPFSQYVNALWFALFGVGLRTLVLANFAIFLGVLALLYALLAQIGSRMSATLGCLTASTVFGFCRYIDNGNYNFICPYSHEVTHGLALSLAGLWFVSRAVRRGRIVDAAAAGLCVGLVFLTKPEIMLAALPATTAGLVLGLASQPSDVRRPAATLTAFGAAALVPPCAAVALLSCAMPVWMAAVGTAGGWPWVFAHEITSLPFYRWGMGFQDVAAHAKLQLVFIALYLLLFGVPTMWALAAPKTDRGRRRAAIGCFVAIAAGMLVFHESLRMGEAIRPLPIVLTALLAAGAVSWFRRPDRELRARLVMPVALALFGLLLTAKMIFFARTVHYGFALGLPGTLVLIVVLWDYLPAWIAARGGAPVILRGAVLAVLMAFVGSHLEVAAERSAELDVQVGTGADTFYDDARGNEVNRLLEVIDGTPADATLAGAPECAMFNYLSRRVNPTRYLTLMPVEMIMFGEERIMAAFAASPPDYIVLTDRGTSEYGFPMFGAGYGEKLMAWILDNYRQIAPPPADERLPLRGALYQRK